MILTRSPLRISLGGGGTDLPSYYSQYGGFICSAAIDKYVYIYANRPKTDDLIRLKYAKSERVEKLDDLQHDLARPTLDYFQVRSNIEIAWMADVAGGTGLGSSGAFLTALVCAINEMKRVRWPAWLVAETAYHIEQDIAKHPVGKHDHYLAALGGLTCLEIAKDGKVSYSPLVMENLREFKESVVLFYTGTVRNSSEILSQQAFDTEQGKREVLESLHHTKALGHQVKYALERGDIQKFGKLLNEHWTNKKRRSSLISPPEIDRWYDIAMNEGAWGGKLMGAGGGGFFMFAAPPSKIEQISSALGLRQLDYEFDYEGVKVLVST